jgi:hypothetical protein
MSDLISEIIEYLQQTLDFQRNYTEQELKLYLTQSRELLMSCLVSLRKEREPKQSEAAEKVSPVHVKMGVETSSQMINESIQGKVKAAIFDAEATYRRLNEWRSDHGMEPSDNLRKDPPSSFKRLSWENIMDILPVYSRNLRTSNPPLQGEICRSSETNEVYVCLIPGQWTRLKDLEDVHSDAESGLEAAQRMLKNAVEREQGGIEG